MKKFIILTLLSLGIFFNTSFAIISPKFGIENRLSYIDLEPTEFLKNDILSNDSYFYIGFELLNPNFYFIFKPAFRVYTKYDIAFDMSSFSLKEKNDGFVTFTFDEIEFSYLNDVMAFYIGKRKFHFGEGFNRQYIFVEDSVFYDDYNSLYNTELNIYQDNITHSIGFITDTKSIDLLEEPQFYTAWYYAKYSTTELGLIGIVKYKYDLNLKNNVALGLEASYIFDFNLKLYGNINYDLLYNDQIYKNTDGIKSLIGINYNYISQNWVFIPYIEYFYEQSHSFYSIGLYTSFVDSIFSIISYFSHSPNYLMDFTIKALISYNNFDFELLYYIPIEGIEGIDNVVECKLSYSY